MKISWRIIPAWAKGILCVLFFFILIFGVFLLGEAFRKFPLVSLAIWISIPIGMSLLSYSKFNELIRPRLATKIQVLCIIASIVVSFAFFAHFDYIRDHIGYKFVEGYRSYPVQDVDNYGRQIVVFDIVTAHWYSRLLLWFGEWGYIIICFGIPLWTWASSSRLINSVNEYDKLNGSGLNHT